MIVIVTNTKRKTKKCYRCGAGLRMLDCYFKLMQVRGYCQIYGQSLLDT